MKICFQEQCDLNIRFGLILFKFLVDEGLYESKEETMQREEVLVHIDQVNIAFS